MQLIPKIYLKNGKAVAIEGTTSPIFLEDPVAFAENLTRLGYQHFHIVDLSVQNIGTQPHLELIKKWLAQKVILTLTGNFVTIQAMEQYIDSGVSLIALQAVAYQQPPFVEEACREFPERIATHIDVKAKRIIIPGWTAVSTKTAFDYAERFRDAGVKTVFYSDVDSQGTLSAENIQSTLTFCSNSMMRVFINSEVSGPDNVIALAQLGAPRIEGLILNKALYLGKIDLSSLPTQMADIAQNLGTEPTILDEE